MSWRRLHIAVALVALLLACFARSANAQVLRGKWVEEAEKRIHDTRMVSVRFVVLTADGKLAQNAAVKVELKRHLFDVGVVWPQQGVPIEDELANRPVYRVLNATSLDPLTSWSTTHPTIDGDAKAVARVDDAISWSRQRSWTVRWGPLLYADPGRLPGWVSSANKAAMSALIDEHVTGTLKSHGGSVASFDLYMGGSDHKYFDDQFGAAFLRRLMEGGRAVAPDAQLCLRYDDALMGGRMSEMRQRVVAREEQLVPIDALAVDGNVRGFVAPNAINEVTKWFARASRPVVLSKMEVGGSSPSVAAVNMETVVRLAYAEPTIKGIYFAGLQAKDLSDPTAALLHDDGTPTAAGQVLDDLFRRHWRTEENVTTDELGNVRQRVYAGWYHLSAMLGDGTTATLDVLIKPSDAAEERVVVLQPLK